MFLHILDLSDVKYVFVRGNNILPRTLSFLKTFHFSHVPVFSSHNVVNKMTISDVCDNLVVTHLYYKHLLTGFCVILKWYDRITNAELMERTKQIPMS